MSALVKPILSMEAFSIKPNNPTLDASSLLIVRLSIICPLPLYEPTKYRSKRLRPIDEKPLPPSQLLVDDASISAVCI